MAVMSAGLSLASMSSVALGGAIGSVLRYAISLSVSRIGFHGFAYATLLVNIIGSLLMGLVAGYFLVRAADAPALRLFLTVGLLGGFTTFSAFSLDAIKLIERGELGLAAAYISGSVLLSLLALALGLLIGRALA